VIPGNILLGSEPVCGPPWVVRSAVVRRLFLSATSRSALWRIGTSGSRLRWAATYRRRRDSKRKKIDRCGFQPRMRNTIWRAVRITWHGIKLKAFTNVLNSMPSTRRLSSRCRSCQRPGASGSISAHHALSVHANAVITIHAQLLSKVFTGACKACTPLCNCASRFS
jgi:hypothetical protein